MTSHLTYAASVARIDDLHREAAARRLAADARAKRRRLFGALRQRRHSGCRLLGTDTASSRVAPGLPDSRPAPHH